MADLKSLFQISSAHRGGFLVMPPPCASTQSEGFSIQECQAEEALLHYTSFPTLHRPPYHDTVEAQAKAWLFNLYQTRLQPSASVQRFLDSRFETLGCLMYPKSCTEMHALTLNKVLLWTFMLEEVIDNKKLLGHDYGAARRFGLRLLKGMFSDVDVSQDKDLAMAVAVLIGDEEDQQQALVTSDGDASQSKALQDVVIEAGAHWVNEMRNLGMSSRQLERVRSGVADYVLGVVSFTRLRQEKRLPDLEDYIRLRRMDGAGTLNFICCEFELGIELDDQTWEHPLIKKLDATTADHMLWLNDLLTFDWEFDNEDYINLVAVLHYINHTRRSDAAAAAAPLEPEVPPPAMPADLIKDAICETQAMVKAVDQERVRLLADIAAWRPDLEALFEATQDSITGITFWTLWSQRYQGEERSIMREKIDK